MKEKELHVAQERILIAINSFKGSLDTFQICKIVADTFQKHGYNTETFPMADGGDGTAKVLAHYLHASLVRLISCDALGRERETYYFQSGNTAIIELATICGLALLKPEEYDILNTTTRGVGIAINHAIENNCQEIILCLGGSASVDGGIGALEAMGLKTTNNSTEHKNHLIGLNGITIYNLVEKFKNIHITLLCDVDNVMYGENGAAHVFGPQKGATEEQVLMLDKAMRHYATLLSPFTTENLSEMRYGGSAGGIAAAFAALLRARLQSGAEYCIKLSGIESHLWHAICIITGEGKIDRQTAFGKIPGEIARKAKENNVKCLAIAGSYEENILFDHVYSLLDHAGSLKESMANADKYIENVCEEIIRERAFL